MDIDKFIDAGRRAAERLNLDEKARVVAGTRFSSERDPKDPQFVIITMRQWSTVPVPADEFGIFHGFEALLRIYNFCSAAMRGMKDIDPEALTELARKQAEELKEADGDE